MTLPRVRILLLLIALVALTPLAYASPPDPAWVPGLYDEADFDDVVQLVTSTEAGPSTNLTAAFHPLLPPAERCWPNEASGAAVSRAGALSIRAPPRPR